MVVLQFILNTVLAVLATLAGNLLGGGVRSLLTGQQVQTIQFHYQSEGGREIKNIPVVTKFYPGLLFALIGRPRWVFTFIGGLLTGALVDDRFEHALWRWIDKLVLSKGEALQE